jgi:hypothetical protein
VNYLETSAVFSGCRRYRYRLRRVWNRDLPMLAVCMLNPSTADEKEDDRTINRVTGFAASWGFGGYTVVNIGAWRETNPKQLRGVIDWIGPDNDMHIRAVALEAHLFVAGWGALNGPKWLRTRADKVLWDLREHVSVYAFRVTPKRMPEHPLYLPGDLKPTLYQPCRGERRLG